MLSNNFASVTKRHQRKLCKISFNSKVWGEILIIEPVLKKFNASNTVII